MDSNTVLRYRLCGLPLVGIYDRRETMKEYLEVFLTALAMMAAMSIGGLMLIGLFWLAKQVL
jgi:hypothetical protein